MSDEQITLGPAEEDGFTDDAVALAGISDSPRGGEPSGGSGPEIARLTEMVEEIQRRMEHRDAEKSIPADVITRIERLERWVASNRLV